MEPGVVEHPTRFSTGETEAGGLAEQDDLQLFEARLGYMASCVKTVNNNNNKNRKELP